MFLSRFILSLIVCFLAIPFTPADDPAPTPERESRIKVPEGPDERHFVLKIQTINANGQGTDDRLFTLLALGKRRFQFKIGGAGITTSGTRLETDPRNVRRLEARLTLTLKKNRGILRTMKFQRGGGSIGTLLPARNLNNLKGVVNVQIAPGRYPIGQRVVIGQVQGKEIAVTVR